MMLPGKALQVRLLGAPQISLDGHEIHVSRRKSRAIVYYLAAQDQPVLRQALLSMFWMDLPHAAAGQTLRTTLTGLRRALGDGLSVQGDRLGLDAGVWVDARDFERRLSIVPVDAAELSQALDLYRGEFLEGFTLTGVQAFEDWLTVSRERFRRLAMRGWSTLAAHYEGQGDYHAALDSLERALAADRLQEDLQRDVMRLLYLAGDRPAAIRRYDDLRRLLDDEMGVPPMAETRRLYDDILNDRLAPPKPRPGLAAAAPRLAMLPRRSAAPAGPQALPFAGRTMELQALQEIVSSGRLALIEGEPGVGKTRLAEHFLSDYAAEYGALPLIGRARELEHTLPYLPLVEALRDLLAAPDWEGLRAQVFARLPAVWLSEVARLLPEIDAPPMAAGGAHAADEARLWEGVRQFLLALAALRPIVVLVDDLQWLDGASLGLLAYLLRNSEQAALRFVATMRPAERKPTSTFLQSLTREDRLRRIALDRLTTADVTAVAAAIVKPKDGSAEHMARLANWLFVVSEGNAYILNELLRFARQNGLLDADGNLNLAGLPEGPVVPQTVFSLIQSRLDRLSDETRRVLGAAVAQGREFEFAVVARASGLSEAAALDALDELQAAGLIQPRQGGWFRFDHPLTMEVAYQEIGDLRHRRMHRRVAEALEQLHLDQLDEVAGQLAWHFFEGNAPERAVRYALQAARNAARLAAWDETIQLYELALRGLNGPARLPVMTELGNAYLSAGHFARASEVYRDALHLAETTGAAPQQADAIRLALARALLPQARFAEVIELSAAMAARPALETAVMGETTWGAALSVEGADLNAAAEHLQRARELWVAGRGLDPALLAQIQFELGSVAAQQGDLESAVAYYRQSLATASNVPGDHALEQRILSYNNLAYHLHLLGDPSAAQYAHQGVELAQEKGQLGLLTFLYSTQGEIALAAGDLDAAEQRFTAGLELAQRFSTPERIAGLNANLGLVALRRGQKDLAIHQLSQALGLADSLGSRHLAAQIRLWLAPLLPPGPAHSRLAEARAFAEATGRKRLLDEVGRVSAELP